MKKVFAIAALACAGMSLATPALAEESDGSVSFSLGADVVSSYIWRGQELGAFSVQPSATITFNKPAVSFGVWASAELFSTGNSVNMREFDLSLSWNPVSPLTLSLTDYYFCGANYLSGWTWNSNSAHTFEGTIAYDFGFLSASWNTVLAGVDHNAAGDRTYSTYLELAAPYKLAGVEGAVTVGASLWEDSYTQVGTDGFKVCNIGLSANKEFMKLPFMGQIVFNPYSDKVFFVVGLSF